MRCTECSMPLSPQRTFCPRCGAPARKESAGKVRPPRLVPPLRSPSPPFPPESVPPTYQQRSEEQLAFNVPFGQAMPAQPISMQPNAHQEARTPNHTMPTRIKLGFTVAGICFAAGTLLLILVAVMTQGLPSSPTTAQMKHPANKSAAPHPSTNTPTMGTHTPVSIQHTPTPTTTTSTTIYIDNVHLASAVNTATGTPLTETGIFHVGQPVYITLTLHQPAYNGAVCLNWSINNSIVPYNTLIGNSGLVQTNAYFFFKPGSSGQGQVDVYWANSTACTNKVPIQHAVFTVVP